MWSKPRLLRVLWWTATITPVAYLAWVVARFAIVAPYLDQIDLVPLLEKMYQGNLTLEDLWAQHNEHRIFFPQLIMLGLARLTGWNIGFELAANLALAAGVFGLLAYQVRVTCRELGAAALRWAIPGVSLIVFSVAQHENSLWGWQITVFLTILSAVGGIVLLSNPPFRWWKLAGAGLLGFVATGSFASGLALWPTGLLVLVLIAIEKRRRWMAVSAWALMGLLATAGFCWHYHKPDGPLPLTFCLSDPLDMGFYVLTYLGNLGSQHLIAENAIGVPITGLAGLGTLLVAGWLLLRRRLVTLQVLVPYAALAAYSLLSAGMTGVGRVQFGSGQALWSRYCTMAVPLWVSIIVTLLLLATCQPAGERVAARYRAVAGGLLGIALLMLALSSAFAVRGAAYLSSDQALFRQYLLDMERDPVTVSARAVAIGSLTPQIVAERCAVLARHRLSIFKDWPPPANTAGAVRLSE